MVRNMNLKHLSLILLLCTSAFGNVTYDDFGPSVTNTWDLGSEAIQFKDAYGDGTLDWDILTDGIFTVTDGIISAGTWQGSTITVPFGGTSAITFTDGGILLGSGTSAITALGVASNGQIPIGDGATDPVLATITAVANETDVTNGAGSITIGIVTSPTLDGSNFTGIPDEALDETYVNADGTVDLTGDWVVSANSITLTAGTLTAASLHGLGTTTQLKLSYDGSNFITATVQDDGSVLWASNKTNFEFDLTDANLISDGMLNFTRAKFGTDQITNGGGDFSLPDWRREDNWTGGTTAEYRSEVAAGLGPFQLFQTSGTYITGAVYRVTLDVLDYDTEDGFSANISIKNGTPVTITIGGSGQTFDVTAGSGAPAFAINATNGATEDTGDGIIIDNISAQQIFPNNIIAGNLDVGGALDVIGAMTAASLVASGNIQGVDVRATGDLFAGDDIFLGDRLVHLGDLNTWIGFGSDNIEMRAGNVAFFNLIETAGSGGLLIVSGGTGLVDILDGLAIFNSIGPVINFNARTIIGTGGNNTEFEPDGTLKFKGNATVFDDIRTPMTSIRITGPGGTTPPDEVMYKGSVVLAFGGAGTDDEKGFFTIQIPHSYKEGSDITPHIHWTPEDNTAGTVRWILTYSWANIDAAFPAETANAIEVVADQTTDKHQRDFFTAITGTGKTISSMILCSIQREDSDPNDTYNNKDAFLLEMDFHFEKDTVGSRTIDDVK